MFFLTYLRRELRRRMRQAIFIALGLAIGIGLVITVMGASAGVKAAQAKVLRALTASAPTSPSPSSPTPPRGPRAARPRAGRASGSGPDRPRRRRRRRRRHGLPQRQVLHQRDDRHPGQRGPRRAQRGDRRRDRAPGPLSAAAGGLLLTDNRIVLPTSSSSQLRPAHLGQRGRDGHLASAPSARSATGGCPAAAPSAPPTRTRTWPWWTRTTRPRGSHPRLCRHTSRRSSSRSSASSPSRRPAARPRSTYRSRAPRSSRATRRRANR